MQNQTTDNLSASNIINRAQSPTPSFWKKIQKIAVIVGGVAATVLAAPVALPAIVGTIATYGAIAAGSIATIAQLTKKESEGGDDSTEKQP